jgi:4-amino-4-deoxy-L-arabinose transferase-like glycosyltransferase
VKSSSLTRAVLLAAVAATAVAILLCATKWGIGISSDSVTYIGAARSLLRGEGLCYPPGQPVAHFPPLYSIALALAGAAAGDPVPGARALHILLYVANVLLVGLAVYRASAYSFTAGLLAFVLMLTSPTVLNIHSMALSEPLFLVLGLAGFLLLDGELIEHRAARLAGSSVLLGLAFLTRYLGIVFLAVGGLAILFWSRRRFWERIVDTLIFGTVGVAPMLLWLARNAVTAGTMANRPLAYHPINSSYFDLAFGVVTAWFGYQAGADDLRVLVGMFIVLVAAIGYLSLYLIQRGHADREATGFFPALALMFAPVYVAGLATAASFVDPVRPHERILSPVYVLGMAGLVSLVFAVLSAVRAVRPLRIGAVGFFAAVATLQAGPMVDQLQGMYADGRQYASREWKSSELMQLVRKLPAGTPIFSNGPDAIYILTGLDASWLPRRAFLSKEQTNPHYEAELAEMMKTIRERKGVIVCFKRIIRWYLPSANQLARTLPLRVGGSVSDGLLLEADSGHPAR